MPRNGSAVPGGPLLTPDGTDHTTILFGMKALPAAKPRKPAGSPRGEGDAAARRAAALEPEPPQDIREAVTRLKRERIVATAAALFHRNGLGNTTLEAVADQMKVTKPFIYSHFKSKNELLDEICARGIRSSLEVLNRVVASGGSATDRLQALAREFMLAVLENQGSIAIYTREEKHLSASGRESINAMRREFDRKFCALLSEGVEREEFIVDDVQLTALAIGGIVSWSYVWYRPTGRLTPAQTADRIAALVMAMVQAKPRRRGLRSA